MEEEKTTVIVTVYKTSSQVKQISYDTTKEKFIVTYLNGAVWAYLSVPLEVYRKSQTDISIGKFLNTEIKPNYQAEKIS